MQSSRDRVRHIVHRQFHVAAFAKTPLGFGLMLGLPAMLIIAFEMRRMWRYMSEEEERQKAARR